MGTTHSLDAFIGKLEKAPKALLDSREDMVKRSALVVTTSIRTEIHRVAPSGRLRGVGKKGAKVSASFSFKGGPAPAAIIFANGPIHLVERDTSQHTIRPRSRRGGRAALRIPNADPKMMFRSIELPHPGTKGKHPFEKGSDRGRKFVPEVMRRTTHSHLAKVFSG